MSRSLKVAIARLLCHPAVGRAIGRWYGDRIPSGGIVVASDSPLVSADTKARIRFGLYEKAELTFIRRFLRDDLDVIELGSSIGVVSSHLARHLAAGRQLVAVEAHPALAALAARNVALNAPAARARVLNRALAAPGVASVRFVPGHDNVSGSIDGSAAEMAITVPATSLGALCEEFGFREFALVCDIEGSEAMLLAQEGAALSRCRQVIIELHDTSADGRPVTIDDLLSLALDAHGFVLAARHGPVCVLERPAGWRAE